MLTYIHIHTHTYIHTYIRTYIHTHHIHAYMYTHTYTHIDIHTHHIHAYIHTHHIHAYIHTYIVIIRDECAVCSVVPTERFFPEYKESHIDVNAKRFSDISHRLVIFIHTYIYTYIHTVHIHTFIHTYSTCYFLRTPHCMQCTYISCTYIL